MEAVVKKLQYRGQSPILITNAPEEAGPLVAALVAAGAEYHLEPRSKYSFALAFVTTLAQAQEQAETLVGAIEGDGILWVCYPKGTSKRYKKPDVNRDKLWPPFEAAGMRPVSQVAIDDDWSALRFRGTQYAKS